MKFPIISSLDYLKKFDDVIIVDGGGELRLTILCLSTIIGHINLQVVRSIDDLPPSGATNNACILLGAPDLTGAAAVVERTMKAAGDKRRLVIAPSSDWVLSRLDTYKSISDKIILVDNLKCGNKWHNESIISFNEYLEIATDDDFIFIPTRDKAVSNSYMEKISHARVIDLNAVEQAGMRRRARALLDRGYQNVFDGTVLDGVNAVICGQTDMSRTARFAFRHLKSSDCAFDVGAHRGQLSAIFRMRCAKVHAFEPEPGPFADMAENLRLDSNVHLHNIAISDYSGEMNFFLDSRGEYGGGSSLFSNLNSSAQTINVNVLTLEDVINQTGDRPDFIKIDVEGAEPEVILGGIDYIKQRKPIIVFEMYQPLVEARRKDFADMLQFMDEIYDLHCLETGGDPVEYAIPGRMPPMTNVGATPKKR